MNDLLKQLQKTKNSQSKLANLSLEKRNKILVDISELLKKYQSSILKANTLDLNNLQRLEMRERLTLNERRINGMARGLLNVALLPNSISQILEKRILPNGLNLQKVSVPLGVVSVIYESRPNVTIDLAGLCIKSGNGLVLKGGSEAYNSNKILVELVHRALKKQGLPPSLVYLIDPKSNWQKILLNARGLVDVLIPRGSNSLIEWVRENSRLPIIETGAGVCHIFVDQKVNVKKAVEIIVNAKTQRPDVCNALDTLVIHHQALKVLLDASKKLAEYRVEIFADKNAYRALKNIYPQRLLHKATAQDFGKEFLSLKMSVTTVGSFAQGLLFIKQHTSGHSEAILSNNQKHIHQFLSEVDASVVYANASTRFTDGEEFGMGAEVGISTQKLHARGPMGLTALTSYKWVMQGKGQVRK